jgi:hypothetical protein
MHWVKKFPLQNREKGVIKSKTQRGVQNPVELPDLALIFFAQIEVSHKQRENWEKRI